MGFQPVAGFAAAVMAGIIHGKFRLWINSSPNSLLWQLKVAIAILLGVAKCY